MLNLVAVVSDSWCCVSFLLLLLCFCGGFVQCHIWWCASFPIFQNVFLYSLTSLYCCAMYTTCSKQVGPSVCLCVCVHRMLWSGLWDGCPSLLAKNNWYDMAGIGCGNLEWSLWFSMYHHQDICLVRVWELVCSQGSTGDRWTNIEWTVCNKQNLSRPSTNQTEHRNIQK